MPGFAQPRGLGDLLRVTRDNKLLDRQPGVSVATIAGNANGDPDMRKLYSDELADKIMTTDGPNGMRCGMLTTLMAPQFIIPGQPIVKQPTSTSTGFSGTMTYPPSDAPSSAHSESEMTVSCSGLLPPSGGPFPWVYYHSIGTGDMPAGYYYFLGPTDGPHPGRGPGWPP